MGLYPARPQRRLHVSTEWEPDPLLVTECERWLRERGANEALAVDVAVRIQFLGDSFDLAVVGAAVFREWLITPIEDTTGGIPNWMLAPAPDFPPL